MNDKTKLSVALFDKYATQYQDKFMALGLYHDTFDLFCDSIPNQKADVLELACGPGNITNYLLKKRPGYKIFGSDLSPRMIELAKINNPTAEFGLMDCRNIGSLTKKYDAVMCGFCLPYLSKEDAFKLINDVAGLLKSGGVLYLSTMEDDYSKSAWKSSSIDEKDMCFIHYHEADYLTAVLKENNFDIIDLQRKDYPEKDGTITKDLIIIVRLAE